MTERPSPHRIIFVDTAAWFALAFERDEHYAAARSTLDRLIRDGYYLLTSNFVAAEFHGLAVNRRGREAAITALFDALRIADESVRVSLSDESLALQLLVKYTDRAYSFVDATSFVIMSDLGIRTAFTFDRHFVQHGFNVIGVEA